MGYIKKWILIVGPLLAAGMWLWLDRAELPASACWTAAITTLCALWWIFEPLPIPATSLIPFAAFPLAGVLDHKQVAGAYGHTLILLFLGGFLLSAAMGKSGAHRRLALGMVTGVRFVGGKGGRSLVLGFMLATAVLSMWISNTATALMMLPIALAVIKASKNKQLAVPLLLGIAYAASIGGIGTPVGTPPNIIFMGVYEEQVGKEIGFGEWMAMAIPVVIVMLPITWLWLTRSLRGEELLDLPSAGKWRKEEVRVLTVFIFTAAAWISRPYWTKWLGVPGVGDSTIALLAAVVMFTVSDGNKGKLLDWPTAKNIQWGLLILFGGGIAIAKGFTESGLSDALGDALSTLTAWPTFAMIIAICLAVTFLTEITSNSATTAMLMPILAAAGIAAGMDPKVLMIPAAMSASCAFMLPVATPPNAVVMGADQISIERMAREGLILNLAGAVVIASVCMWLVAG